MLIKSNKVTLWEDGPDMGKWRSGQVVRLGSSLGKELGGGAVCIRQEGTEYPPLRHMHLRWGERQKVIQGQWLDA